MTVARVAGAAGIIVGFFVVLQYTVNDGIDLDPTVRIISGIIGLAIIVFLAIYFIIIPYIRSSGGLKTGIKLKLPSFDNTPTYNAEITDKKLRYVRGTDSVHFRSRFVGKLTHGFFANHIFTPEHHDGTIIHVDYFDTYTPDISDDRRYVTSRCKETLEHWNDLGKLNGKVKPDWKEWSWEIPEFAPLGKYHVKMMVWNTFKDGKKEPFRTIEDTFEVIDPDNSHYRRSDRISIS